MLFWFLVVTAVLSVFSFVVIPAVLSVNLSLASVVLVSSLITIGGALYGLFGSSASSSVTSVGIVLSLLVASAGVVVIVLLSSGGDL